MSRFFLRITCVTFILGFLSFQIVMISQACCTPTSPQIGSVAISPSLPSKPTAFEARYVFTVDLDGDGHDELLRATADQLVAHQIKDGALSPPLWSTTGPGQAHKIALSRTHTGLRIFVAWGMGPGMLNAPLSLTELKPSSGEQRLLWRHEGSRSQAVHLEIQSLPTPEDPENIALRLAHFVSKYQTQALTLSGMPLGQNWTAQSTAELKLNPSQPLTEKVSRELRMGTSWAYADLDGDGIEEEIVGRVYGDKKGEYGELSLYQQGKQEPQVLPTERGVKAVYWAQWGGDEGAGAIYFSDGWVAEYGQKARARLKRVRWREGRASVELVAASNEDFTFFELWTHSQGSQQPPYLFARGNRALYLISPQATGPWKVSTLLTLPPVVNASVLYAEGAWWIALPIPKKEIQLQKIMHPLLDSPSQTKVDP